MTGTEVTLHFQEEERVNLSDEGQEGPVDITITEMGRY